MRTPLLALLGLHACGWHAGTLAPEGAETVAVEVATRSRDVLERGLEPLLSEELSRATNDLAGLLPERPARADLVLEAEITRYRRRGGVRSGRNRLLESAVELEVRARLRDAANGRVLRESQTSVWSGFAVDDPTGERTARDRALRHVAETLVLELFPPGGEKGENPRTDPE